MCCVNTVCKHCLSPLRPERLLLIFGILSKLFGSLIYKYFLGEQMAGLNDLMDNRVLFLCV